MTSELIASGKDLLASGDVPNAVDELSEACEFLAKEFGETAEECAEAYLYYGKALLELGRLENKVLGNALEGFDVRAEKIGDSSPTVEEPQVEDPEGMTVDEKWDVEEKVAAALEENFGKFDKIVKVHMGVDDDSEGDSMDEEEDCCAGASEDVAGELQKKTGEMSIDSENGKDVEMEGKNEVADAAKGTEDAEDSEDAGNLQAAWEVLELAKLTFGKTVERTSGERKKEAEEKVCAAILALGEVSMENENYDLAVDDFKLALEKSKEVLPADSRFIAEVYYQLGLALGNLKLFPEAEEALGGAIAVLEAKKGNLDKLEASEDRDQELAELACLVSDIEESVQEHKEAKDKGEVEETSTSVGFNKAADGKTVSAIGIKRPEDCLELAKDGGSAGPATA